MLPFDPSLNKTCLQTIPQGSVNQSRHKFACWVAAYSPYPHSAMMPHCVCLPGPTFRFFRRLLLRSVHHVICYFTTHTTCLTHHMSNTLVQPICPTHTSNPHAQPTHAHTCPTLPPMPNPHISNPHIPNPHIPNPHMPLRNMLG
jgi:hypothetical protein